MKRAIWQLWVDPKPRVSWHPYCTHTRVMCCSHSHTRRLMQYHKLEVCTATLSRGPRDCFQGPVSKTTSLYHYHQVTEKKRRRYFGCFSLIFSGARERESARDIAHYPALPSTLASAPRVSRALPRVPRTDQRWAPHRESSFGHLICHVLAPTRSGEVKISLSRSPLIAVATAS